MRATFFPGTQPIFVAGLGTLPGAISTVVDEAHRDFKLSESGWTTPTSLLWTPWAPLERAIRGEGVPPVPGLYRIQRSGRPHLDYVGQTGAGQMTLRKRMAMLRGVYETEMPYRDPHTAGPALWAIRRHTTEELQVAFAPVIGETAWRKALECVVIAEHRLSNGASPTANFGRMPPGYRMSSANNRQIVEDGRRFRGGPSDATDVAHLPGVSPAGALSGTVTAPDWCGHRWSPWVTLPFASAPAMSGLYRIRAEGAGGLVYIGEGVVGARLRAHLAKIVDSDNVQGQIFSSLAPLEASWVVGGWANHERLELENDLIAAHMLTEQAPPVAQFRG